MASLVQRLSFFNRSSVYWVQGYPNLWWKGLHSTVFHQEGAWWYDKQAWLFNYPGCPSGDWKPVLWRGLSILGGSQCLRYQDTQGQGWLIFNCNYLYCLLIWLGYTSDSTNQIHSILLSSGKYSCLIQFWLVINPLLEQLPEKRPEGPIPTCRQPSTQATTKVLGTKQHHVGGLGRTLSDLSLGESSVVSKRNQEDSVVFLFISNNWMITWIYMISRRISPQNE